MIMTLTRLYKEKGETVLDKAIEKGWITEEIKNQIIADAK